MDLMHENVTHTRKETIGVASPPEATTAALGQTASLLVIVLPTTAASGRWQLRRPQVQGTPRTGKDVKKKASAPLPMSGLSMVETPEANGFTWSNAIQRVHILRSTVKSDGEKKAQIRLKV